MKNLLCLLLLSMCIAVYARGPYFGNEYDPEDGAKYHDREMTDDDLKKFQFPKPFGYKPDQYGRKCGDYKPYMRRMYSCPNYRYYYYSRYLRRDRCPEDSCDFYTTVGETFCHSQVTLMKPYMQEGRKCETSGMLCSGYEEEKKEDDDDATPAHPEAADDEDEDAEEPHNTDEYPERKRRDLSGHYHFSYGYVRPKPSKPPKCTCQTIWCTKDIWTMYKVNEKMMKGYVRIKIPCRCDCRRKNLPKMQERRQDNDE